ncbi:MAG: amidohydrolase family protein, partial [Oscillospiraceae bacterium]
MEDTSYVPAVLIHEGIIEKIGDFEELKSIAPEAEQIDLQSKTMLPAFIDAHSHFSAYANAQLQIPLIEALSIHEITQRIEFFMRSNAVKVGEWVVASDYDHNALLEKSHPHIDLLDRIAPENPLVLHHKSGHCGVFNTKALSFLGITSDTVSPSGGLIGRVDGKLTGYLEEEAYISSIKKLPISDFSEMLGAYVTAQKKYLSNGITTIQEGMMIAEIAPLYEQLLASNQLLVDVVVYPDIGSMKDIVAKFPNSLKKYDQHLKIGGYKIFLDGSPQVKTAWMQSPYKGTYDYFGYGTMSDADVLFAVETSAKENIQILAHCNGDAAIQQYINTIKKVALVDETIIKLKPVIIHSQLITKQQLVEVA